MAAKLLCLAVLLAGLAAAVNPQLVAIHTVYIFPMASGMDQYLAGRLTTRGVVQVVSDPQRADAVLTDNMGQAFERRMDELYAPPKKDTDASNPYGFNAPPQPVSTFSRGRGAFFLVDRKSRLVLWSVYEAPRSTHPDDLEHTADRIAQNLAKNMATAGKKK